MALTKLVFVLGLLAGSAASAACPFMEGALSGGVPDGEFLLDDYVVDDAGRLMTSDWGSPIADQSSLRAGERGPTLLEDFVFRNKIQRFDHERVPERVVHARGSGAHGEFVSYGDWSNITAADFLGAEGKTTPMFVRFSTVAGPRGSADTARDVHGFAAKFYTQEGNFDIVGNNIPVFFIQDAIRFPDLIHSVKMEPDSEIPTAATGHNTAWDFFSQQPSALHTLFWAMSPHGTPRGYRFMDGFGVHTFRFVNNEGQSKLVKFHWKSLQGKASLFGDEATIVSGTNADFHRQDLFDAIANGFFPEWELGVQIMEESDELRFGFDLFDPTKLVPEELVPVTPLGKMTLNRNPINFFAETEQVAFQPGHVVRGIDFTEDPLLQGRLFSYMDTALSRNGGPNFEQLPINRPVVSVNNNNRDGFGQMFIPLNAGAYTPQALNPDANPVQADESPGIGKGFLTAPSRRTGTTLIRADSPTFADVWSQPRLFFNSLLPAEQQSLVDGMRSDLSGVTSHVVRTNAVVQLNRVSHELAARVGAAFGIEPPAPEPQFYHDNRTDFVSVFNRPLARLDFLKVALLTSTSSAGSSNGTGDAAATASALKDALVADGVQLIVVAEDLFGGADMPYLAADATKFDAVVVAPGAEHLVAADAAPSALFPAGRPRDVLQKAFHFGKTVGAVGSARAALGEVGIEEGRAGVVVGDVVDGGFVEGVKEGLRTFKHLDRFEIDPGY
ncbi:catalase-like domain-containing protein [Lineolata rhizophorae]|uniref:Catalase n=1 Tax=Lineolata rhizophorae TaxID=578093 RepID=A0A6A6NRI9_9PEZI|nr:catalase-like domain-containing protein [Lineolata rhizophorae]